MEELRHKYNLLDIEEDIRHIKADISSCRQEKPVEKSHERDVEEFFDVFQEDS